MARSTPRSESAPAPARPRPKKPAASRGKRVLRRREAGMDIFHLLSAVAGAFAGLALFALMTPGHTTLNPLEHGVERPDARADLRLMGVKGAPGADGLYRVSGQLYNSRQAPCRLAQVAVRFFDAKGKLVTRTVAQAEGIAGGAKGAFEARAHAKGAVRFEVAVDYASY